ncbi:MAG TPA: hypothetical protein DEA44_09140 [Firmicutes bacterium]|nr:hypothetical protein [Bacillota bacterium]
MASKLATARTINGVSFDGSGNITVADSTKAPIAHSSSATTYGISTASVYGHAMASSATPLVAGTAAVGTDNGKFAREGHVHPAQTTITGNAGTATKLATARTITLTGGVSGSASFDGSADISITTTSSNNYDAGNSLTQNGYQKFSNGLILQWGSYSAVASSSTIVTLPIAFPTRGLFIGVTHDTAINAKVPRAKFTSTSQITLNSDTWSSPNPTTTWYWFALGY